MTRMLAMPRLASSLIGFLLAGVLAAGCAPASPEPKAADAHPTAAEVPPGEVRLRQIHPDIWVHVSTMRFDDGSVYPMNGLVVRDGDGVLIVDTAWGEEATAALLNAIAVEIGRPVRRAVVTHFHDDRLSGAPVLERAGVAVYATPLTRKLALAENNAVPTDSLVGLERPGAAATFGPIEVVYPGAGHTVDNVVVYVPGARVLFGGCAVHEAARETAGNVADADLEAWPQSIRRVRARYPAVDLVVPGHGPPGGADLLAHTIDLVEGHPRAAAGS